MAAAVRANTAAVSATSGPAASPGRKSAASNDGILDHPRPRHRRAAPKPTVHLRPPPFEAIERAKQQHGVTDVAIYFSGGKDSVAALDVCYRHFGPGHVAAIFMYLVPGLRFQEQYLTYIQRLYSRPGCPPLVVHRIPYAEHLALLFRANKFRHPTAAAKVQRIPYRAIDAYVRKLTGWTWIANGERACESVQRNAMIRHCNAIDEGRGRFWPLAFWSDRMVLSYLRQRKIALAPEYSVMGLKRSFASLFGYPLKKIREHYPDDFEKICEMFPLARAQLLREGPE